jgi:predicted metal-binding membrane protein
VSENSYEWQPKQNELIPMSDPFSCKSSRIIREQAFTGAVLAVLVLLAWFAIIFQIQTMPGSMEMHGSMETANPNSIKGSDFTLLSFLSMWNTMTVAMMLPAVIPMIFSPNYGAQQRKSRGQAAIFTVTFVVSYLAPWILFGTIAYGVLLVVQVASQIKLLQPLSLTALALFVVGIYQFSPLKETFINRNLNASDWTTCNLQMGDRRAWQMGLQHGISCIGSCWGLMLIPIVAGSMNLLTMGLITGIILAERVTRRRLFISHTVGIGFVALGIWSAARSLQPLFLSLS